MSPLPNRGEQCLFSNSTWENSTSQKQSQGIPGQSQNRIKHLLILGGLVISIANVYPAAAHEIKIAGDVGATLHIEPNDNPRAGEPTQAWFALTRRGGKVIPLKQCNCRLAVYAKPYIAGEPALLEPSLKPVQAERYRGIPGADIIFPKPGAYELQLRGKPIAGANFKPFQLKFEVTVATGSAGNSQNVQDVNSDVDQSESKQFPAWAIALPILGFIGILFVALRGMRGGRE